MFRIVPKKAFKSESVIGVQCLIRENGDNAAVFRLLAKWFVSLQINSLMSSLKKREKYSIGGVVESKVSGKLVYIVH